jgi:hypothetical protein
MLRMDSPNACLIQASIGVQPPSWVSVVPNFPLLELSPMDTYVHTRSLKFPPEAECPNKWEVLTYLRGTTNTDSCITWAHQTYNS